MDINEFHLQVLKGEKCPYCKSGTKVIAANSFYDVFVSVDFVVVCRNHPNCEAYTHAYPKSTKAQGRLVKKSTMRKRTMAYKQFNRITLIKRYMTKKEAIAELSEHLNVPLEYADICYLNDKNCMRAETWAINKFWHFEYKRTGKFTVPMTVRNGKRKKITVIEQVDSYNSVVEFDEDGKRMMIDATKIFFFKPRK
jgi:hypothetical protein